MYYILIYYTIMNNIIDYTIYTLCIIVLYYIPRYYIYIYNIQYYIILLVCSIYKSFPGGSVVKNLPAMQKTWV